MKATEVMTLYMAKELGERRITVNAIAPAAIETDFMGGEAMRHRMLDDIYQPGFDSLKRLFAATGNS